MKDENKRRLRLNYEIDEDIVISTAKSYEELMAAHSLCYDVYLNEGYIQKNPHRMRLSLYHSLPSTTTFIATIKGKVVGTLMAIADNPLGLPCDNFFDLNNLKVKYSRIVEGSGYAIHKDYRGQNGKIFFMLYNYFFKFVKEYLSADCVLAAINPKQKSFYNKILLFDDYFSHIVPAQSANGAPAILLKLDLNNYRDKYLLSYGNAKKEENLFYYMFEHKFKNFIFPEKKLFIAGYPTLTPNIFRRIFTEQWSLFKNLNHQDLQTLRDIYSLNEYDQFFINPILDKKLIPRREHRFGSVGYLIAINNIEMTKKSLVKDVSKYGLLAKFEELPVVLDKTPRKATIKIAEKNFNLTLVPIWSKNSHIGFQILNPPLAWIRLITSGKYEVTTEQSEQFILQSKAG